MTGVLGYARTFLAGGVFRPDPLDTLDAEVERFHGVLADLGQLIGAGAPLRARAPEQLRQGPLSDAMTYAGQLAMLRRLAGSPAPSENFMLADVSADRLDSAQPLPAAPTPTWMGRLLSAAWSLSRWWTGRQSRPTQR